MPIYEYDCAAHGSFELARSISDSSRGAPCPVCDAEARRIISAPNFGKLARSTVRAMDRNEKNRHEPTAVRVERAAPRDAPPAPAKTAVGGRPWMIGHG